MACPKSPEKSIRTKRHRKGKPNHLLDFVFKCIFGDLLFFIWCSWDSLCLDEPWWLALDVIEPVIVVVVPCLCYIYVGLQLLFLSFIIFLWVSKFNLVVLLSFHLHPILMEEWITLYLVMQDNAEEVKIEFSFVVFWVNFFFSYVGTLISLLCFFT